ncbi:hypothetical protein ABTQ33_04790 [Paucilactobacillus suebicus]|uniref:Uncharacterized protein n=1 Tax=Paucilactobacillus suebicus DSM 5007 = KCTC 3549 TaxID=1423807 RepID=A0A0R1WB58_9LACO|nr:hypothetical protein [Paucilactobacillus suebicus]KRM12262.1 hypothetical protein FD16_GL002447 [Paucilactobacillus suebicus DSM 5007 = KCTC 3549]
MQKIKSKQIYVLIDKTATEDSAIYASNKKLRVISYCEEQFGKTPGDNEAANQDRYVLDSITCDLI